MKHFIRLIAVTLCLTMLSSIALAGTPSIIAYYNFDNASDMGADSSANGNNLVTAVNPSGITYSKGRVGAGSAYFGGSSGFAAADSTDLYINGDFTDSMTGSYTISYYAKIDVDNARQTGNTRALSSGIQGCDPGMTSMINLVNNNGSLGAFNLNQYAYNGWFDSYAQVNSVRDWHNYIMVYDADNNMVTSYVDGVKKAQSTVKSNPSLNCYFTFAVGGSWARDYGLSRIDEGFIGWIDDVKIIDGAVYDVASILKMGRKVVGYPNNTICTLGPSFRDLDNPKTDKWYTFTPLDLSQSGTFSIPLVGGNCYVIGEVVFNVNGDTFNVNYRYFNNGGYDTEDLSQYITLFNTYDEITTQALNDQPDSRFEYGKDYSISGDLGGCTTPLLFVCNRASFYDNNGGISRYIKQDYQELLSSMKEAAIPKDPTLLAYYRFDDAADLGADASDNGNNLVTTINPNGITYAPGKVGNGSIYLDGNSGFAAADSDDNGVYDDFTDKMTGSFTVSYYAKIDTANARQSQAVNTRVLSSGIQGCDPGMTSMLNLWNNNGNLEAYNLNQFAYNGWFDSYAPVDSLALGDWHHYVMVYDASKNTVTSYIDGAKEAQTAVKSNASLKCYFTFAVGGSWARDYGLSRIDEGFIGWIDDVKIIDGALFDIDAILALGNTPAT